MIWLLSLLASQAFAGNWITAADVTKAQTTGIGAKVYPSQSTCQLVEQKVCFNLDGPNGPLDLTIYDLVNGVFVMNPTKLAAQQSAQAAATVQAAADETERAARHARLKVDNPGAGGLPELKVMVQDIIDELKYRKPFQ